MALAVLLVARAGWADPTTEQKSLARSLFEAGREGLLQGRYAESCAQFAESQRLDPQPGTQLNLAVCHVREGKTATAWIELREAKTIATKSARADRIAIADEELKALEPRLQRLVVEVPAAADVADLQIAVDGVEWRRAAWGIATVLDPGRHTVRASAPGRTSYEAAVMLSEDGKTQRFAIPPLPPADTGVTAITAIEATVTPRGSRPEPTTTRPPFAEPRRPNGWYTAGVWTMVVGGLGSAGAGTASLLYVLKGSCATRDRGHCPEQQREDMGTARTLGWTSLAGVGVFTAGVVMASFAPYPKEQRAPVEVHVRLSPTGAAITGAF